MAIKKSGKKIALSITFIIVFLLIAYYNLRSNYKPGAGDYENLVKQKAQTMPYSGLKDSTSIHVPKN